MSEQGIGELLSTVTADEIREWNRDHKQRGLVDKVTSPKEAVQKYIKDGMYLAIGGFGHIRISMPLIYEMVRQRIGRLRVSGHTAVHDLDVLIAGDCVDAVDVAYSFAYETRGLSKNGRRAVESGRVKCVEWTNAALSWRIKAAAMGLPFLPARNMLGSDTFKYSAARTIECPFTGQKLVALPALMPDVSIIHVHYADRFGNCLVRGTLVKDDDLAKASKRVLVTAERIVPDSFFRDAPERTTIPYFCVDAVIEAPFGSHPGNMPYEYYFDEEHIREYMKAGRDEEQLKAYLEKYVYSVDDFEAYLDLIGMRKLNSLRRLEELR
ncbi:MAG: CoA transferase subunit A [Candidatus Thermoplasmatota archaeon]|nr:CoA transferase subunit A [Candidatus Thermoplasmatota archaeon]